MSKKSSSIPSLSDFLDKSVKPISEIWQKLIVDKTVKDLDKDMMSIISTPSSPSNNHTFANVSPTPAAGQMWWDDSSNKVMMGMDTSSSIDVDATQKFVTRCQYKDIVSSLIALMKMKTLYPDSPMFSLIEDKEYKDYKQRAERLLEHTEQEGEEREDESILLLEVFFNLPKEIMEKL